MIPIRFQVVGEEDYAFSVEITQTGEFVVNTGTYTSHAPRSGVLTPEQESALMTAISELGIPEAHPIPDGGEAFGAVLVIGEGEDEVTYPFWEGALEEDGKLQGLVRLLEKI